MAAAPPESSLPSMLVLGDGDLSWSRVHFGESEARMRTVVVSVLETRARWLGTYSHDTFEINAKPLQDLGIHVEFGVDATQLDSSFPAERFECIRWNFPFPVDMRQPKDGLMRDFLTSVKTCGILLGRIEITLARHQFQVWGMAAVLLECGFYLSGIEDFDIQSYTSRGYHPRSGGVRQEHHWVSSFAFAGPRTYSIRQRNESNLGAYPEIDEGRGPQYTALGFRFCVHGKGSTAMLQSEEADNAFREFLEEYAEKGHAALAGVAMPGEASSERLAAQQRWEVQAAAGWLLQILQDEFRWLCVASGVFVFHMGGEAFDHYEGYVYYLTRHSPSDVRGSAFELARVHKLPISWLSELEQLIRRSLAQRKHEDCLKGLDQCLLAMQENREVQFPKCGMAADAERVMPPTAYKMLVRFTLEKFHCRFLADSKGNTQKLASPAQCSTNTSVSEEALPGLTPRCVYKLLMAEMQMHSTTALFQDLLPSDGRTFAEKANTMWSLLVKTAWKVDKLARMLGIPASMLELMTAELHYMRERVLELQDQVAANRAAPFARGLGESFPVDKLLLGPEGVYSLPLTWQGQHPCGSERAKELTVKELRGPELWDPLKQVGDVSDQICNAHGYVRGLNAHDPQTYELALAAIENTVLPAVEVNFVSLASVETLEWLLEEYRRVADKLVNKAEETLYSRRFVELRSTRTLVHWGGYCTLHRTVIEHAGECGGLGLLQSYGVSLNPAMLGYLTLSCKRHVDALAVVARYLAQTFLSKPPLFHLGAQEATMKFALSFARGAAYIQNVLARERRDDVARISKHWERIEEQKQQAGDLRTRIAKRAAALNALRESLATVKRRCLGEGSRSTEELDLNSRIRREEQQLQTMRQNLRDVLRPPPAVRQPLPRSNNEALALLFFLFMPSGLRALSRMSLLAQQILFPECVQLTCVATDWSEYFNSRREDHKYLARSTHQARAASGALLCTFDPKNVPDSDAVHRLQGLRTVDDFVNETCGVWYPDGTDVWLCWKSDLRRLFSIGSGNFVDPFAEVAEDDLVNYYTVHAEVPRWCLTLRVNELPHRCRGNMGEAWQHEKPKWLATKDDWYAFASMRAHGSLQLRKLLFALQNNALPLPRCEVLDLVTMVLCCVGQLATTSAELFTWKHDLQVAESPDNWQGDLQVCFFEHMLDELRRVVDIFLSRQRDAAALQVLLKIISVLVPWIRTPGMAMHYRTVARRVAGTCLGWAAEKEIKRTAESDVTRIGALVRAERRLAAFAILAFESSETDECAELWVRAAVRLHHTAAVLVDANLDQEEHADDGVPSSVLQRECQRILPRLVSSLDEEKACMMAGVAFAEVVELVEKAPLCWHKEGSDGTFVAQDDTTVYGVNLVSGAVVVDGQPPGRLPRSIVHHDLYRRTFGDVMFEVVVSHCVYTTTRSISGASYSFELRDKGELVVLENAHDGRCLRLLSPEVLRSYGFPGRLVQMHSHWLDTEACEILFRGVNYLERTSTFVFRINQQQCSETRSPGDYLVKCCSPWVTAVFHRFEDPEQVHFFGIDGRLTRVTLPRYKLQFTVPREGTELCSTDMKGYVLASRQKLEDTLLDFEQYLVLESAEATRLLVASGCVGRDPASQLIEVRTCKAHNAKLAFHLYDRHPRFGYLESHSVASRLQLASVYAAHMSSIPERGSCETPGETACTLIRGCWSNCPLDEAAGEKMQDLLGILSGCRSRPVPAGVAAAGAAALSLLESTRAVHFLHDQDEDTVDIKSRELLEYYREVGGTLPPRVSFRLDVEEERRLTGLTSPPRDRHALLECDLSPPQRSFPEAVRKESEQVHALLRDRLQRLTPQQSSVRRSSFVTTCPLEGLERRSTLAREMVAEQQQSYEKAMQSAPETVYEDGRLKSDACRELVRELDESLIVSVRELCLQVRTELLDTLNAQPPVAENSFVRQHEIRKARLGTRLRKIAQEGFAPSELDIVRIALNPEALLSELNPCLSVSAQQCILNQLVLPCLKLWILEDKLVRVREQARQEDLMQINSELGEDGGSWNYEAHPEWLAFEVIQRLQIREEQYKVAMELLGNPGTVTQLPMGRGKTRVILPMIILYLNSERHKRSTALREAFGCKAPQPVPVVNIPVDLLSEAHAYLTEALTASVLHVKFFLMPFHREVQLNARRVGLLRDCMKHCRDSPRACLLLAPEHRLSMILKGRELSSSSQQMPLAEQLESVGSEFHFVHVIDESDDVLRHNKEFNYAIGRAEPLPSLNERVNACVCILRAIQTEESVRGVVDNYAVPTVPGESASNADTFRMLYIVKEESDEMSTTICTAVMDALLRKPPHELSWLVKAGLSEDFSQRLREYVCDPGHGPLQLAGLRDSERADLMALRGVLGCGLLLHCLRMRHAVNYGVNPTGKKRLAVPFRAADTPAGRNTEYQQPDVANLLTLLSYYATGLRSQADTKEAFAMLLRMSTSAQQQYYGHWCKLARTRVDFDEGEFSHIDEVRKLDLTDSEHVALLYRYFAHNYEVVNFWLSRVVFPSETAQFPQRVQASAWNLAQGPFVVGFSGTNDTWRTLPYQLEQTVLEEQQHANGAMLHIVAQNPRCHFLLGRRGLREELLEILSNPENTFSALIDPGGLTVGVANRNFAYALLARLSSFEGVVFFDTQEKCWCILDRVKQHVTRKGEAALHERDCFAFFDQARSRGSDLKLRKGITALVTLGAGMNKDRLLQGCARLRALAGRQQRLEFVAPAEVRDKITACRLGSKRKRAQAEPLTSTDVLRWAMANSIETSEQALPVWAHQGSLFATALSPHRHEATLLDEILELHQFYDINFGKVPMPRGVLLNQRRLLKRFQEKLEASGGHGGGGAVSQPSSEAALDDCLDGQELFGEFHACLGPEALEVLLAIQEKVDHYCKELCMVTDATTWHGETEREVAVEQEREIEQEREVPMATPRVEGDWDKNLLWRCSGWASLAAKFGQPMIWRVGPYCAENTRSLRGELPFPAVGGTKNFLFPLEPCPGSGKDDLDDYLRVVDAVALLPDGSVLCLSDREMDDLLRCHQTGQPTSKAGTRIVHFTLEKKRRSVARGQLVLANFTQLELFRGETEFHHRAEAQTCVEAAKDKDVFKTIVDLRGRTHLWHRSTLEWLCEITL